MSIDARTIIGHAARTAVETLNESLNAEIAPITFEGLEGRQLMSGVALDANTLRIDGGGRGDDVRVTLSNDGRTLYAKLNDGKTQAFDAARVWSIDVNAGNGDNRVMIDPRVVANVDVTSGNGNDTVVTGAGRDVISTGYGRDVVQTNGGSDSVDAGASNDKVDLGAGSDLVNAGSGNDSVVAGDGWDQLFGRRGNDTIYAKSGDLIDAGSGRNNVSRNGATGSAIRAERPKVTRLSLVNADTGVPVSGYETLWTGMTLDLAKLPANVTIVAEVNGKVESARFKLGDGSVDRVDNAAGYSLTGGHGDALARWSPALGNALNLTVTPYAADNANGTAGAPISMTFAIKRSTLPTPTPAPAPAPAPAPTPAPWSPNAPVVTVVAMSTTVTAGQAFHAEATRTVVPGFQAEDATFAWDFGDAAGRFNTMPGFNAAHVYETPGTYTARLTVTAPGGQSSVSTVRVNVVASDRRTVYVAANGNDANDGASTNAPVRSLSRALALTGDSSQVLLKRGDTFTVTSQHEVNRKDFVLGSYGSGTNPTILWTGARSGFNAMLFIPTTAANVVIRGLTFNSIFAGDAEQTGVPHAISNGGQAVTVRDNTFLNVGYAINNNAQPKGLLVMDNKAPLETGIRGYFVWVQGSDLVIVGNSVANSTREHVVRVGGADRFTIAYNKFNNLDRRAQGDSRDTAKGAIVSQKGSYSYIAYNQVRGPIGVGPLGGADGMNNKGARFRHSAVEGNVLQDATIFVNHGGENVTVRGNTIYRHNEVAVVVQGYDAAYGRGVVDAVVKNNVGINDGTQGNFLNVSGPADGITLTDNVYVAPHLLPGSFGAAAVFINDYDLSSFRRIDGNVWPSTGRGSSYARGGMVFLGKSYTSQNHRTANEWNALTKVGDDAFQDVQLDRADDVLRFGTQAALRLVA